MQQAHQSTCIANGLFVPYDGLLRSRAFIFWLFGVLLAPEFLVGLGNGEDEQEGQGRAGNEGEELRLVDAEDIVKCKLL